LRSPCFCIAKRIERLKAAGLNEADLERIPVRSD
jgi:hypothetical protein